MAADRLELADDISVARPLGLHGHDRDVLAWFDGVWIAAVMTAMLFVQLLGSLSALIILASVPAFLYVRRDRIGQIAPALALLAVLPLWALFSALWSDVPGLTVYYGVEYLVTILVGVILGIALDRDQAIYGLFFAFAAHAIASVTVGNYVDVGKAGSTVVEQAFVGIMVSKNIAADASGVGILVSGAAIVGALRNRQLPLLLAAVVILAVDIWMVLKADSTGALVAAIIATAGMISMQPGRFFAVHVRMLLLLCILGTCAVAFALQDFWLQPLMDTVLTTAGKDATLTGRTYIWTRAWSVIETHPALGVGYNAFWYPGNPEAEIIWDFAGIADKRGFNFHNSMMEILVHFGYFGVVLFGLIAAALALNLLVRVTWSPTEFGTFAVAYLCFVGARAPVESFGLAPFLYSTALIAACLAYGLRRRPA